MKAVRDTTQCMQELRNIVRESLVGEHAHFAERNDGACRYDPAVTPFGSMEQEDVDSERALAELVQPGEEVCLLDQRAEFANLFDPVTRSHVVRMTYRPDTVPLIHSSSNIRSLVPHDVDLMERLIAEVFPGFFRHRTNETGRYYGIFSEGQLAAMAGERFTVPGMREISAICTSNAHQGKGLAAQLTSHAIGNILRDGRRPFLHVGAQNSKARRLYAKLGFEETKLVEVNFYRRK